MRICYAKIVIVLTVLLFLILVLPVAGQESTSTPESGVTSINPEPESASSGVTADRVHDSLERLTQGDKYDYSEGSLDDPPWVLAFKDWLRNLMSRWQSSPMTSAAQGEWTRFAIILSCAILLVGAAIFLLQLMGRGFGTSRSAITAAGINNIPERTWGEEVSKYALELASGGKFRDAVSVLFKSTLKSLDNMGWIKYRQSVGSRGYLRQLRKSAELYPLFRDLLGRFEVAYYAKEQANEDDWNFIYGKYRSLAETAGAVNSPITIKKS
jgi:hypothetical protein